MNISKSNIYLENSDCMEYLDTLKDSSIDLCIIDPPYTISKDSNFSSGDSKGTDTDRFRISIDFGEWDKELIDINSILKKIYRILKPHGTIIVFYDLWKISSLKEDMEDAGFKQIRFIEWIKTNPTPINSKINYLTNAREIALVGVKKGKPTFNSIYDKGVYEYPLCHDPNRFHPTQKPLELIKTLIDKHSNRGDVVLDCFSGSGTTAVACLETGRVFYGCELSKEYYDKSMERIKNSLNGRLF